MYLSKTPPRLASTASQLRLIDPAVFQLVTLTLPGDVNPAIAIAAARAGGLGVLSLEWCDDPRSAQDALSRMLRFARGSVGIKLDTAAHAVCDSLLPSLPDAIRDVILVPGDTERLPACIAQLQTSGHRVWLEVSELPQARLGQQLGVDGLLCKGHEAGGLVGDTTSFILLQQVLAEVTLPVWAQGGIGIHTAAAVYAAGAAGVVLDSQLALTRESPLPAAVKSAIAAMDGSETVCLGSELGHAVRVYQRPGNAAVARLRDLCTTLQGDTRPDTEINQDWRRAIASDAGWADDGAQLWLLGQDAAFAAALGQRYQTVSALLAALRVAVEQHVQVARDSRPLDAGAPLAQTHGTRYPIVQGPMTRVSDRAEFALEVAKGGGLPFLALALMRGPEVAELLETTRGLLGDRPWGVGILGFVPLELRQEQMEVIRQYRPPFALIAGGRPDQALGLEKDGIPTYLHVPSPGLLRLFLKDGARRFIFEGRECGGHVGPRSSFVLWNTMVDVLLDELPTGQAADCQILFAGGIHDALSASMVAAMAAPLVERGVHVGVLLGTAYLFTAEAVASGAIQAGFQEEAVRCERTLLVESGPGHAVRLAETPYGELFEREKQRMQQAGHTPDEIREHLEDLNIGRLRIASKGITRHPDYGRLPEAPKFLTLSPEEQRQDGMYMIGQVATLRDRVMTIADLHDDVAAGSSERLAVSLPSLRRLSNTYPSKAQRCRDHRYVVHAAQSCRPERLLGQHSQQG